MSLLLSMLPIYLLGNLHCIGMCGPLVLMIGRHRYRTYYFAGRIFSFTLAGTLAGGVGAVAHVMLRRYQIPALTSFLFGGIIIIVGIYTLIGRQYPGHKWLAKLLLPVNQSLSGLMLRDSPWPTFLFGFFTIALPCGQTLIVYSACALAGDVTVGTLNGFVFALLTSPSLWLAMNTHTFFKNVQRHHDTILGSCALIIGALAICRGLAELGIISHFVINHNYHIVLY